MKKFFCDRCKNNLKEEESHKEEALNLPLEMYDEFDSDSTPLWFLVKIKNGHLCNKCLYIALQGAVNLYYEKSVKPYELEEKRNIIKELLESTRHTVWCRNASVVQFAHPCSECECEFKQEKVPIEVHHLLKCNLFQITELSINWSSAKHIYPKPEK